MASQAPSELMIKTTATLAALVAIPLTLFQFWPFTVTFMLLGAVATAVISLIVGHVINYLLVLLVQFVLMELVVILVIFCYSRRGHYVP